MGLPTNIKTLLTGNVVEWARIEFKASWKPEASLKTICAFANDLDNWGGGYIILGVEEENGRPVLPVKGIPVGQVDAIMKDLLNKCNLIQPHYLPVVAPAEYEGKMLIVIWAAGGDVRPYSSPLTFEYEKGKAKPSQERAYFIRKMSSTVRPSQDELNELYSLSNKVPFDDRINHNAELSNLNVNLIRQYLNAVGSAMVKDLDSRPLTAICEDMGICNNMPEYRKPKNVGLMFFADEPDKFFPYAQIDVVAFPEGLGGNVIDEQSFKGPLDQQLRDALRYIRNTFIRRKIVKHPDRAEADHIFNYPYAAIEEALANAVYHRGYDVREPIEVRIEAEKIEIVSYPGPVRSVTKEQLKHYQVSNRRYRNRRIGEFLKELHLTEGRSTGFKKILDAIHANGSPLPEFETDDERTYFITRIFVHEAFRAVGNWAENENDKSHENVHVNVHVNDYVNGHNEIGILLENVESAKKKKFQVILEQIYLNNNVTIEQLSSVMGVVPKTIYRYIAEMKEKGILRREGADKNGTWVILWKEVKKET